jgi:hypothetical protein
MRAVEMGLGKESAGRGLITAKFEMQKTRGGPYIFVLKTPGAAFY